MIYIYQIYFFKEINIDDNTVISNKMPSEFSSFTSHFSSNLIKSSSYKIDNLSKSYYLIIKYLFSYITKFIKIFKYKYNIINITI